MHGKGIYSRRTARELPSVGRVYNQLHLQSMMLNARPLMNLARIIFIYIKAKKHAMRSRIYVILCAKSVIP